MWKAALRARLLPLSTVRTAPVVCRDEIFRHSSKEPRPEKALGNSDGCNGRASRSVASGGVTKVTLGCRITALFWKGDLSSRSCSLGWPVLGHFGPIGPHQTPTFLSMTHFPLCNYGLRLGLTARSVKVSGTGMSPARRGERGDKWALMDDEKSGGGAHRVPSIGSPHISIASRASHRHSAQFLSRLTCDAIWSCVRCCFRDSGQFLTAQCPRVVVSREMDGLGLGWAKLLAALAV